MRIIGTIASSISSGLPATGLIADFDFSDPSTMVLSGSPATSVVSITDKSSLARVMGLVAGGATYNATGGANNLPYIFVPAGTEYATAVFSSQAQPFTVYTIYRLATFIDGKRYVELDNGNSAFIGSEIAQTVYSAGAYGPVRRYADLFKANQWQVLGFTFDNNNAKSNVRINNEPTGLGTYQEGGPGGGAMNLVGIGPYYRTMDIDFQRIVIYAGDMPSDKDKTIRSFLISKYAPVKHNYLAAFGDSITTGALATNIITEAWVTLVAAEKGMNQYNYGVSGSVAVPTASHPGAAGQNFVNTILALEDGPDFPTGTFVISYGTNDQSPDAAYKATLKSTIQTKLIDKGVALNKIIITTAPAFKIANQYMRDIASELGITLFDAEAYIAANGGAALFNADGLHLNTTGHRKFADGLKLVMI